MCLEDAKIPYSFIKTGNWLEKPVLMLGKRWAECSLNIFVCVIAS